MYLPSLVFFFSSTKCPDDCLWRDGLALPDLEEERYGEGKEEADVLAGALRRPKGSLCFVLDMRRMEPVETLGQPTASHHCIPQPMLQFPDLFEYRGTRSTSGQCRAQCVPGTSSVRLSLRIPMLHFSGLILLTSSSSIELLELTGACADFEPPHSRFHNGTGLTWLPAVDSVVWRGSTLGCWFEVMAVEWI